MADRGEQDYACHADVVAVCAAIADVLADLDSGLPASVSEEVDRRFAHVLVRPFHREALAVLRTQLDRAGSRASRSKPAPERRERWRRPQAYVALPACVAGAARRRGLSE